MQARSEIARFTVRPRSMALWMWGIAVAITIIAATAHVIRNQYLGGGGPVDSALKRLDLVEEPSLTQWYASSLHFGSAILLACIAMSRGQNLRRAWWGLSALFLMASVDEAIMIHEMMDRPTREFLDLSGAWSIAWIIPGSAVVALISYVYCPFLFRIDKKTARRFIVSAGIFLTGAVLMEIPGGYYHEKYGFATSHYIATYFVEETLELTGSVLFIRALLLHLCFHRETLEFGVGGDDCRDIGRNPDNPPSSSTLADSRGLPLSGDSGDHSTDKSLSAAIQNHPGPNRAVETS